MRPKASQRWPFVIKLPKGAVSPTGSIYKLYDIVQQGSVLVRNVGGTTVRSAEGFKLRVSVNGKIREIEAKRS